MPKPQAEINFLSTQQSLLKNAEMLIVKPENKDERATSEDRAWWSYSNLAQLRNYRI